jgi:FixJ family two-component response regulator
MVIRDPAHSRGLVLVVEGNDGMRQAVDNLLDAAGFSGIGYSKAQHLIAGGRIDDALCVITDINLPAGSGFELLNELRARNASLPVILISAKDTTALRRRAEGCGAAAFLAKPFPGTELLAAIERIAESMRLKRTQV